MRTRWSIDCAKAQRLQLLIRHAPTPSGQSLGNVAQARQVRFVFRSCLGDSCSADSCVNQIVNDESVISVRRVLRHRKSSSGETMVSRVAPRPSSDSEKVRRLIADYASIDAKQVTDEAHLSGDLGLDWLDQLELLVLIEDEFTGVEFFANSTAGQIELVGDLIRQVEQRFILEQKKPQQVICWGQWFSLRHEKGSPIPLTRG